MSNAKHPEEDYIPSKLSEETKEDRIYEKVRVAMQGHTSSFVKQAMPARDPELVKNYMGQIVGIEYTRQIEDIVMASFQHEEWAQELTTMYPIVLGEVIDLMSDLIPKPNLDLGPHHFEEVKAWLVDAYNALIEGKGFIGSRLEVVEEDEAASGDKLVLIRDRALGKSEGVAFIAIIGFALKVGIETDEGTKPIKGRPRQYTLTGNVKLRRYELGPEHPDVVMQEIFTYNWKDKGL